MPETTAMIVAVMYLRSKGADKAHPVSVFHLPMRSAPGLLDFDGYLAWLTPAGWELAERMIAAADDQLVLFRREQDGTLTDEDAEKRRVA